MAQRWPRHRPSCTISIASDSCLLGLCVAVRHVDERAIESLKLMRLAVISVNDDANM